MRVMTLQLEVRTPDATGENEVETAVNEALDETPQTGLYWGDWTVGAVTVTDVRHEEDNPAGDEEEGERMNSATLVRIGDDAYTALALSEMTYGSVPADDGSAGAVFLRSVAARYLSDREEIRDGSGDWQGVISNAASELATQGSSAATWKAVADLRLYADAEDGSLDYGLWADQLEYTDPQTFTTERVWAVRKGKLTSALEWWLYETALALLHELRRADLANNPEPDEEEDEG